jgi:hypothetical protein
VTFRLVEAEDYMRILPSEFGKPLEEIALMQLRGRYEGRVVPLAEILQCSGFARKQCPLCKSHFWTSWSDYCGGQPCVGIPPEEITFKESMWEGGGNAGECFEVKKALA